MLSRTSEIFVSVVSRGILAAEGEAEAAPLRVTLLAREFSASRPEFVARVPRRAATEDPSAIRATPLVAIRHAAGVGHRRKVEINMRPLIASWLRCRVHLPGAEEPRRSRSASKPPGGFPLRFVAGIVPTVDLGIYILRSAVLTGSDRFVPSRLRSDFPNLVARSPLRKGRYA